MNSLLQIKHRQFARWAPCRLLSAFIKDDIPPDFRPRRIILLRHGESQGNVDQNAYVTTADWRIPITDVGRQQAAGEWSNAQHFGYDTSY